MKNNKINYKSVETLTGIIESYARMIDRARNKDNPQLIDFSNVVLNDIYASAQHVLQEVKKCDLQMNL